MLRPWALILLFPLFPSGRIEDGSGRGGNENGKVYEGFLLAGRLTKIIQDLIETSLSVF